MLFLPCVLPSLRLSPNVEPSSTVVSLEWLDVQPAIGTKVSDYVLQHKKVDEYTDTDLYTGGCDCEGALLVWKLHGDASCAPLAGSCCFCGAQCIEPSCCMSYQTRSIQERFLKASADMGI